MKVFLATDCGCRKCFAEVCELDIVFAWDKTLQVARASERGLWIGTEWLPLTRFSLFFFCQILDEIVVGGLVLETNTHEILIALKEQKALENKP